MWVAYKDSVYDVTDYLKRHPGGMNYIVIAAGGYLEPYFQYYKFHENNQDVRQLLESFKIGELHPDDQINPEDFPKYEPEDPNHPVSEKSNNRSIIWYR